MISWVQTIHIATTKINLTNRPKFGNYQVLIKITIKTTIVLIFIIKKTNLINAWL